MATPSTDSDNNTNRHMDLSDAFNSYASCQRLFKQIYQEIEPADPTISLLFLEGLYRIEYDDMKRHQMLVNLNQFKNILRKWRCSSPLNYSTPQCPVVLQCLRIFKSYEWKIPLYLGYHNHYEKLSLADYEGETEDIVFEDKTEITVSVRHHDDEDTPPIPSKCNVGARWYRYEGVVNDKEETKLSLCGLWQGEVVYNSTKREVTTILYAASEEDGEKSFKGLKVPTFDAIREKYGRDTERTISIVVPADGQWIRNPWDTVDDNSKIDGLWQGEVVNNSTKREVNTNPYAASRGSRRTMVDDNVCSKSKIREIDETNGGESSLPDAPDKIVETEMLDLVQAFVSPEGGRCFLETLTKKLANIKDPLITVIAMEGLYRLGTDVSNITKTRTLPETYDDCSQIEESKRVVKDWGLRLRGYYGWELLYKQKISEILQTPSFYDDYGDIRFLESFRDDELDDIFIKKNMTIGHVTHCTEAKCIANQRQFEPSNRRNLIKGTWFGLESPKSVPGVPLKSVYGTKGFKTTLQQLGIKGLEQGEIVYYKYERNVILNATNGSKSTFEGLKQPKLQLDKDAFGNQPYVTISIFVPSRFLPSQERFWNVVNEMVTVDHGPFCVAEKRGLVNRCPDGYN